MKCVSRAEMARTKNLPTLLEVWPLVAKPRGLPQSRKPGWRKQPRTLGEESGGSVKVRTVWITEREGDPPRFVTAYPV